MLECWLGKILLIWDSIFSDENLRVKRTKGEKIKNLMTFHSSVAGWEKKLIMILLGEIF